MRALVLHPVLQKASSLRRPEQRLEEAVGLAQAIRLEVVDAQLVPLNKPRPSTLLGSGQIERLTGEIKAREIGLVVVDSSLSPVQQRNLEKEFGAKVIDRTALILEIFGDRARTAEGKLQVELASLEYQKGRLVRSWTHLERQRGGFGFLGGPGESQIETDRRLIRDRISAIKKQLEKVVRTRELHRKVRREVPYPLIALIGYTNAGKSTLFNTLTKAEALAENALFATLDPTIRRLELPSGMTVLFSDTVGFVSDLPTQLIAAFRATLEEVLEADLLLHVRDISHPDTQAQEADVQQVLKSLFGEARNYPLIEVLNKTDRLSPEARELLQQACSGREKNCVAISAVTRDGVPELLLRIDAELRKHQQDCHYELPATAGRQIAWLYEHGQVTERNDADGVVMLDVKLSPADTARFEQIRV